MHDPKPSDNGDPQSFEKLTDAQKAEARSVLEGLADILLDRWLEERSMEAGDGASALPP